MLSLLNLLFLQNRSGELVEDDGEEEDDDEEEEEDDASSISSSSRNRYKLVENSRKPRTSESKKSDALNESSGSLPSSKSSMSSDLKNVPSRTERMSVRRNKLSKENPPATFTSSLSKLFPIKPPSTSSASDNVKRKRGRPKSKKNIDPYAIPSTFSTQTPNERLIEITNKTPRMENKEGFDQQHFKDPSTTVFKLPSCSHEHLSKISITDVSTDHSTVTVRECPSQYGFFNPS